MRVCLAILGVTTIALSQTPQPATSFEVVSIRPTSSTKRGTFTNGDRATLTMENISLKQLILSAYSLSAFQLSGPGWLDAAKFDLIAKLPAGSSRDQRPAMLRTMLQERFHLTNHTDTQMMSGYALTVSQGRAKIQPVDTGDASLQKKDGVITGKRLPLAQLVDALSASLSLPIVDHTNLPGLYDFKLEWSPDVDPIGSSGDGPASRPSLFSALQEQLGLKLEKAKIPVPIVVIDHVDKTPTDN